MTASCTCKREDLRLCGRDPLRRASRPRVRSWTTTTSASIRPRVAAFMKELDEELWKLGVLSKTKHNEVAPGQHEMAPIYCDANTACDQNQLTHGDHEEGRRPPRPRLPAA